MGFFGENIRVWVSFSALNGVGDGRGVGRGQRKDPASHFAHAFAKTTL